MVLFIILGVVVCIAFAVLGVLFFMLGKEQKKAEETAVPVTDLDQLRKELSTGTLQPQTPKPSRNDPEFIPAFVPDVRLPTQDSQTSLENKDYKRSAEALEDELRNISKKAQGQWDEAKHLIETLTQENESLKIQQANLEQARRKLVELQGEASNLKIENLSLESQLETTNARVRLLEEQMTSVKMQMGEEISRANATVTELQREKENLLSAPRPDDPSLRQEFEVLQSEQIQLKQKYDDLERTCQKLRELNTHMAEKNDLLQYELIKARAQSSGLERVSFNYKNQLEKNHSRLLFLERECEDLKTHAPSKGPQV